VRKSVFFAENGRDIRWVLILGETENQFRYRFFNLHKSTIFIHTYVMYVILLVDPDGDIHKYSYVCRYLVHTYPYVCRYVHICLMSVLNQNMRNVAKIKYVIHIKKWQ
jgi:hypothetical protein